MLRPVAVTLLFGFYSNNFGVNCNNITYKMSERFEKETFRLGLILADTPIEPVVKEYGDYIPIFTSLLEAGLKTLKEKSNIEVPKLEVVGYKAVGEGRQLPELSNKDNIDGYLITGSAHNAYDDVVWINELVSFTKQLLESDSGPRLVGICFGHQIIARALRPGSVERNPLGWEVGPLEFRLTPLGKQIFEFQEDVMAIQQMHRDHVIELPQGYENLGSNDISPIQGMYRANKSLSVQGHPEYHDGIVSKVALRRYEGGIFDKEEYDEIVSRLNNPHDGIRIALTIWKFFLNRL